MPRRLKSVDENVHLAALKHLVAQALIDCRSIGPQPKLQIRSKKRLAQILDSAVAIFARDGVSAARIADVAHHASVPISSLYEYFPSKEALVLGTAMEGVTRFLETFSRHLGNALTFRDCLDTFLHLTVTPSGMSDAWLRVYHIELWPAVVGRDREVAMAFIGFRRILLAILDLGARNGEWRTQSDPSQTAIILTGSIHQLMISTLVLNDPLPVDIEKSARSMVKRLLTSVLPAD